MNANRIFKRFLFCLTLLTITSSPAILAAEGGVQASGEVTSKVVYFNYTDGPGAGLTPYLQSYGGAEAWNGDRDHGFYADFDFSLNLSNDQRSVLILERQGFGPDNHRTEISSGNSIIGFDGYYSHFRTNSGGVDYVNRPGTAANPVTPPPGAASQFNDDSGSQTSYKIERTRYGMELKFKPDLLGKGTALAIRFDGYNREGNKFSNMILGTGDVGVGTADALAQAQARWRGYDKPVDENMGRASLNFTASPAGLFQLAYDGSHERFNTFARTVQMTDFRTAVEGTVADPRGLNLLGSAQLHFVPDSTLMTHNLRLSRSFGNFIALAAGYGVSSLEQESFSNEQIAAGYTTGEINTENAFLNINVRFSPTISMEGYFKSSNRDNDSSDGSTGTRPDRNLREAWGVRINSIESDSFGLSATFSGLPVKSTLTVGLKKEDIDRDLQFNNITATSNIGIWPTVTLYGNKTESEEFYLRWNARPMNGMTLRLTPSIIRADKTGFVTEAEESINLKAALGYMVTPRSHLNAYYHYKNKENGNNSFINTNKPTNGPIVLGTEYRQKADDTYNAAGISLNHMPSDWVTLNAGVDWSQNDFETYYLDSNVRRLEQNVIFNQRGASTFKVDTLSFTFSGDYQPTDTLRLRAGYTVSQSDGDLETTAIAPGTTVSGRIDHDLQSLTFGVDYEISESTVLKGSYTYDYFTDKIYSEIEGGYHAVMLGLSMSF